MATILPFKAVRPTRDKVGLFATRTYLSYSKRGLTEKLINNPYTFLQIINPDFNQKKKFKGIQKFELIKKKYKSFLNQEIIKKDKEKLAYAGLDVFENEPNPSIHLLMHNAISMTPHIGAATLEAQDRIGSELAEQIISFFKK